MDAPPWMDWGAYTSRNGSRVRAQVFTIPLRPITILWGGRIRFRSRTALRREVPTTGSTFTTTTYDALGRPTQITDGGGGWTKYTYTANDVYVEVGPLATGD